jgi:hypothetical protein
MIDAPVKNTYTDEDASSHHLLLGFDGLSWGWILVQSASG